MRNMEEVQIFGFQPPPTSRSQDKTRLAAEFHVAPRNLLALLRALERESKAYPDAKRVQQLEIDRQRA